MGKSNFCHIGPFHLFLRSGALLICSLLTFLSFTIPKHTVGNDILERERELASMPSDTARANLLIDLGEYYCSRDFERALLYLREALELSASLDYRKGVAGSFLWLGRSYFYKDDYLLATQYLEKARNLYEEMDDAEGMVNYYFAAGAIKNLNGNFLNATDDFQKVIDLSELSGNLKMKCLGFISLGSLNIQRSAPKVAMNHLRQALVISEMLEDLSLKAVILANTGKAFELTGMYDSAFHYLERSLEVRIQEGEDRGIASVEFLIGSMMIKAGKPQNAIELLDSSRQRFVGLDDNTGICSTTRKMAEAYDQEGDRQNAIAEAEKALEIAREINNPSLASEAYGTLAKIMASNGFYNSAYQYQIKQNGLRDSLTVVNNERIMREMEVKFQTARKDDEIKLLKSTNEIKSKNNLLLTLSIVALSLILTLALILFHFKSVGMARHRKLFEKEKVINEQTAEIREKEQLLMKEQLESKNRELAAKALEMLRLNETISNIIEKLEEHNERSNSDGKTSENLNAIISGLETQLKDNTWVEFEKIFKNIHSEFFHKLFAICANLTPAEIKVAAFLRLNLNTKEIAAVTYKSEAGVKSARYRLRQKLGLQSDDNLVPFLMQL
jgi:tetratricopeptide (TPR) repeat protein